MGSGSRRATDRSHQPGGDLADVIRDMTAGRGTDLVSDAVGMEAHGLPIAEIAQQVTGMLPDAAAKPMMQKGRN